jgi:diadenosine tetraphosphate (Ap4A) HIT family hydrolase
MTRLVAATARRDEAPRTDHCDFCNEFAGGSSNAFHNCYQGSPRNRLLLATERFRVFPSIGQLVEGYLLIAPLSHYTALDEMPADLLEEFGEISRQVRTVLSETYGPCVCFEHGARGPANGGCGIYHAHLHAVPLSRSLDQSELLKSKFSYREIIDLSEIRERTEGLPAYLLYMSTQGSSYVFDTGSLPSQYMRKLLAEALGNPQWDWRTAGREERLLATLNRLSHHFNPIASPQDRKI